MLNNIQRIVEIKRASIDLLKVEIVNLKQDIEQSSQKITAIEKEITETDHLTRSIFVNLFNEKSDHSYDSVIQSVDREFRNIGVRIEVLNAEKFSLEEKIVNWENEVRERKTELTIKEKSLFKLEDVSEEFEKSQILAQEKNEEEKLSDLIGILESKILNIN